MRTVTGLQFFVLTIWGSAIGVGLAVSFFLMLRDNQKAALIFLVLGAASIGLTYLAVAPTPEWLKTALYL